MPAPLRDQKVAMDRFMAMCPIYIEPCLNELTYEALLEENRIARVWEPGLAVSPGEVIVPTVPNGWMYVVDLGRDQDGIPGGVTGDTEPRWPLDPRWPHWEPRAVNDGTVRFRLKGREILGLWDLKAAAHAGWLLKASIASGDYSTSLEGNSFHPETVIDQCLRMAAKYAPVRIL